MDTGTNNKPEAKVIREWLQHAEKRPRKCFLCFQIWLGNRSRHGTVGPIKLAGVSLSPEMQISHLAHCLGRTTTLA